MKLHLGCGERYWDGWVNVDLYAERVDKRIDLSKMGRAEFGYSSCSEIAAHHVVEHLNPLDAARLFANCYAWLAPGGTLAIEMPDRLKCIDLIRKGTVHTDQHGCTRPLGALGIVGGRPHHKPEFMRWLRDNQAMIRQAAESLHYVPVHNIPDQFHDPGSAHLYVWTEAELIEDLPDLGFTCRATKPKTHGKRTNRDMRVEATKT